MSYRDNKFKREQHDKEWKNFFASLENVESHIEKYEDYSGAANLYKSSFEKKLANLGINLDFPTLAVNEKFQLGRHEIPLSSEFILPFDSQTIKLEGASPSPSKPQLAKPPEETMLPREIYPDFMFESQNEQEICWFSKTEKEREEALGRYADLLQKIGEIEKQHKETEIRLNQNIQNILSQGSAASRDNIVQMARISIGQNNRYQGLFENLKCWCDEDKNFLVVELKIDEVENLIFYDGHLKNHKRKFISKTSNKSAVSDLIYSMQIWMIAVLANVAKEFEIDTVGVNIRQKWFDKATGKENNEVTASLQSQVSKVLEINLEKVLAKDCFNYLEGVTTPLFSSPSLIKPIFDFNTDDDRPVDTKNLIGQSAQKTNLAMMDWEDFEHLVAQVFELEFSGDGTEIRVTQSSRDRGVDAILFDPNPLKGGKYILQAKRYTNVVGVSAVRDLYGTIVNEGANRGILITTASFGPDAYEFAKNKPISLVDGANLLLLLKNHRLDYVIDIEEVKRNAGQT